MRIIVQKSLKASVTINDKVINSINHGLVLLVGFTVGDNEEKIKWMVNKIANLRIFDDQNGIMNLSIKDVGGEILAISQFTLYGDVTNGNRPSYIKALKNTEANVLYEEFLNLMNQEIPTKPGKFGANMMVSLINDGPTTIILER
jgi:D-aminoacyl-tRNA deacylase